MKSYILFFALFVLLASEGTLAGKKPWQKKVELRQWEIVTTSVQTFLTKIQNTLSKKKYADKAEECEKKAKDRLDEIAERTYKEIKRCIDGSENQDQAEDCVFPLNAKVFSRSSLVVQWAKACAEPRPK